MANLDDATKITSGIALNTLVYGTLEFVRQQLSGWRDDLERPEEESEEKLNSNLCDYLNYRARHSYPMAVFHHEEFQTGRRRIDLSVKTEHAIIAGTRKFTKYDIGIELATRPREVRFTAWGTAGGFAKWVDGASTYRHKVD